MASTFTTIQTNVANHVQDTSNEMKALIATYINNKYREILRRANFEAIDEDYTFPTVAGTQDYKMPTDFKKELYVNDDTNDLPLTRISMQDWADNYLNVAGNSQPTKYVIYENMSGDATPVRQKYMRLAPTPAGVATISAPYTLEPVDLSGVLYPVIDCEQALEYGAASLAFRFKRQYAKANDWDTLFEKAVNDLIWSMENQPNFIHKMNVLSFDRDNTV